MTTEATFDFIHEEKPRPYRDKHPVIRHVIRKRATRAAAQTKKLDAQSSSALSSVPASVSGVSYIDRPLPNLLLFLPSPILQRSLIDKLGRQGIQDLRLAKIGKLCKRGFLHLVNDFHGRTTYLDDAINCLQARIRHVLGVAEMKTVPYKLYICALTSVRSACIWGGPPCIELWIATMCLTLYELFNESRTPAWLSHFQASLLILEQIGAHTFNTEAHRTMLVAATAAECPEKFQLGPICDLGGLEWQQAVSDCIVKNVSPFHDRGEIVLCLQMLRHRLPNGTLAAQRMVLDGNHDNKFKIVANLTDLYYRHRAFYTRWKDVLATSQSEESEEAARLQTNVSFHMAMVMLCRSRSALEPTKPFLAGEAKSHAESVLKFAAQECMRLSRYTKTSATWDLETHAMWMKGIDPSAETVDREAYRTWLSGHVKDF